MEAIEKLYTGLAIMSGFIGFGIMVYLIMLGARKLYQEENESK